MNSSREPLFRIVFHRSLERSANNRKRSVLILALSKGVRKNPLPKPS
jgi:hypothetical protein